MRCQGDAEGERLVCKIVLDIYFSREEKVERVLRLTFGYRRTGRESKSRVELNGTSDIT